MNTLIGVAVSVQRVRQRVRGSPADSGAHRLPIIRVTASQTNPTHQADQDKFEEFEAIADGLGPLFNAHPAASATRIVTGGGSQVLELRVGHKGPDGTFPEPDIPINGGSVIIRALADQPTCHLSQRRLPTTDIQERVPESENIRNLSHLSGCSRRRIRGGGR